MDRTESARDLFKLNAATYPQSPRVYESLGNYYEVVKDTEKATQFYGKALALKDSPVTRQKLARLQAGK